MSNQEITFLVLDIDGVCTDGKLHYSHEGLVSKAFFAPDGLAIKTALLLGLGIGVITGRDDKAVAKRMEHLGIQEYYAGYEKKVSALEAIHKNTHIPYSQMSYLGDDWIDIAPMLKVAYPMAVANACKEVKNIAKYVTLATGGNGAVREAIEHIFYLKGKQKALVQHWLQE